MRAGFDYVSKRIGGMKRLYKIAYARSKDDKVRIRRKMEGGWKRR